MPRARTHLKVMVVAIAVLLDSSQNLIETLKHTISLEKLAGNTDSEMIATI